MITPVKLGSGRPMRYGFGLTADTIGGRRIVQHGGGINGFISSLIHLPDDSLIVAVLTNTTPSPADAIAMGMVRAVLGLPAPTPPGPPKDIALDAAERAKYVGDYALTRTDGTKESVRIFEENGQLMLQPEGRPAIKLMNQGGSVFIAQGAGRIAFDVADGKATGFVIGGGARTREAKRK